MISDESLAQLGEQLTSRCGVRIECPIEKRYVEITSQDLTSISL